MPHGTNKDMAWQLDTFCQFFQFISKTNPQANLHPSMPGWAKSVNDKCRAASRIYDTLMLKAVTAYKKELKKPAKSRSSLWKICLEIKALHFSDTGSVIARQQWWRRQQWGKWNWLIPNFSVLFPCHVSHSHNSDFPVSASIFAAVLSNLNLFPSNNLSRVPVYCI